MPDGRMNDELERSESGLMMILSWHLPGEAEVNHKKNLSVPAKIQNENLLNTSLRVSP
jgi:hypothetical protein